jgi:hypothetical protein
MKPLAIALSGTGKGWWGEMERVIKQMYNVRLFRIVTINASEKSMMLIKM